jgi:serine/threonine-protein kinase
VVVETSDVIETGRVIRTDPIGDSAVAPGSAITVFVSTGKNSLIVPSVVGQDAAVAVAQLTAVGLVVTSTEQSFAAGDPNVGKIIAQSIAAGTSVEPGSAIAIIVGRAEAPTAP